jgi:hypothetical protein
MQKKDLLIKYGDWADYLLRMISGPIAGFLARYAVSPNAVTVFRSLFMFFALYLFSRSTIYSIFIAGLIVQLCDILDYVDGDLARLSGKTSKKGEWLEYFENNLQGTAGSLLGFFIALGIYAATHDSAIWILLFFVVFGVHMKKALIVSPIKSDAWVFNILDQKSFGEFESTANKNLMFKIGKIFVWLSTRDINLIFLAAISMPFLFASCGYMPLYCALLIAAIAHNLTWVGIALFQWRSLVNSR